jgi:hypothetical protein
MVRYLKMNEIVGVIYQNECFKKSELMIPVQHIYF